MKSSKLTNVETNQKLATSSFAVWLQETKTSLQGKKYVDVPCNQCTVCCQSSYFIHIRPADSATLEHIPKALVFPAPGLPQGNFLLGYNENGSCPMFLQGKCSIYEHRPQTCRHFDCRIFPATGLKLTEKNKTLLAQHAEKWEFDLSSHQDESEYAAVQAAAKFLSQHGKLFPAGFLPGNITQQAIMAIDIYEIFLDRGPVIDESEIAELISTIVELE